MTQQQTYQAALEALKALTTCGVTAQQTHDLLEVLHDAVNDHEMCKSIFDCQFAACDWLDREEAEAENAAEEDRRVNAKRNYQSDEEGAVQRFEGWMREVVGSV